MSWQQPCVEARQPSPRLKISAGECVEVLDKEGVVVGVGEEDGIDLDGYEEYLEHLKSKAAVRPCSARVIRHMPTESPQFYMVNADNLVPTRPARPASARPRMTKDLNDDRAQKGIYSRPGSAGMRRNRQDEKLVHARIRAVYSDVGHSSSTLKQMPASYSATSAINNKFKVFQEAELHDEYYRLLDAETELKTTCLQEQQKRMKAIARVRRLEEIVAMKDKKIESLLHAKAIGADRSMSSSRSVVQREMAERDRQFHALTQKLRQKIAQQSQLLSSYEEAMQSLRSGAKTTNLMQLEEERSQLYQELQHHQDLLDRQRLNWETQEHKLTAFAEAEAVYKLQLSNLQQENKLVTHEKRKLEQEVAFLKSRVELLQNNLTLEQRKRTYDREIGESVGKYKVSSPERNVMLAQALEEMKNIMRRESISSIKREKLKSPKTGTSAPRQYIAACLTRPSTVSTSAATTTPILKTRRQSAQSTQKESVKLAAAVPVRTSSTSPIKSAATTPSAAVDTSGPTMPNRSAPSNAVFSRPRQIVADQVVPKSEAISQAHLGTNDANVDANSVISAGLQHISLLVHGQPGSLYSTPKQLEGHTEAEAVSLVDNGDTNLNIALDLGPTEKQNEYENSSAADELHCSEVDPGDSDHSQNQLDAPIVEKTMDLTTEEEMEKIQQRVVASATSLLRINIDDDLDSELSADMLDDAHHPMLRNDGEIEDIANIMLEAKVGYSTETSVMATDGMQAGQEETPKNGETPVSGASSPQHTFDELYPSDFLETDGQTSMGDESESGSEGT